MTVRIFTRALLLALSVALLPTAVVAQEKAKAAPADHHYFHKTEKPHASEWTYEGATGPSHWGDLSADYALAKNGKSQSPIDITTAVSKSLPKLDFDYKPSRIHLIYNGHSIQENEDPGSVAIAGDKRYRLEQFHFHSPSEHTINGKHFPMEMHLVHKSDTGSLAVVAVMIQEGEHNHGFDALWSLLPGSSHPKVDSDVRFETQPMLPKDHRYYTYEGSLTTPPCSEHVRWAVLANPVSLSKEQIERFRAVIKDNNRPVQPLNGRLVTQSK